MTGLVERPLVKWLRGANCGPLNFVVLLLVSLRDLGKHVGVPPFEKGDDLILYVFELFDGGLARERTWAVLLTQQAWWM